MSTVPLPAGPSSRDRSLEASALVFAALFPTLGAWLYFFQVKGGWLFHVTYAASKAVQFTLPVVWLMVAGGGEAPAGERAGAGSPAPGIAALVARGLGWGLAMGAVIGACYVFWIRGGAVAAEASQRVTDRLAVFGASTLPRYVALAALISFLHSWLEEYYWRWFLFARMRARIALGPAALLSSLAFASHHVVVLGAYLGPGPGAWWIGPLGAGVVAGGLVWARLYERTGTILPGWISHIIVDLAIMAVGWDLAQAAR